MADDNCDERVAEARNDGYHAGRQEGFRAGRRAGVWLAFNGPRAQAQARRVDVQAMRRQDVALEGLGDVFGRAEQQVRIRDAILRLRRRQQQQQAPPAPVLAQEVFAPPAPAPAPAPAPPAPAPAPVILRRMVRPRRVVEPPPAPVVAQQVFQAPAPAPAPALIQRLPSRRELIFELRESDAPALRQRLQGISAQEIYNYYKTQPPQRESMRELATKLGVKHRAPGEKTVMDARRLSQALARHLG